MLSGYEVHCICGVEEIKKYVKTIIQCTECKAWQHKDCLKSMIKMRNYLCPKCQIVKGGLFYNIIYTLLEPVLFELENNRDNHGVYHFIPDVKMYPKIKKIQKKSPEFIIIRCLRFDKSGFSFHWPKMSKIYLNDKLILDFTQKGSKKKDKMIALVSKEDFEKNNENENFGAKNLLYDANIIIIDDAIFDQKPNRFEINVNYSQTESIENTNFAISIDCCEILVEPNEIIKKVPIYHEKRELKELLVKNEDENNILSTKEKINLLDLYTESERIKLPARGINCCHLNVFDLETFLLLNRKTNKYQCPYCKRYANNLYIDGIILDFIKDKKNYDVDEILIDKEHNILSYIHKDTNELINNDKSGIDQKYNIHYKEYFDINKKFLINLSEDGDDSGTRSFFENKKFNIISNLGQIFEIIKDDFISEQNDKKHFSNNIISIGKNPYSNFMNFNSDIISKFQKKNDDNFINYKNMKIYDMIDSNQEQIENIDLILPLSDDESTETIPNDNKTIPFFKKKTRDSNFNNALHKNLFNEIIYESEDELENNSFLGKKLKKYEVE